jgi:alpha-galactosidase
VLAAWRLMDAIRERWPQVEIEACAGGGGRIDAGIARRTRRFWTSDCIDAVSRVEMQAGFLQFMPPELMGSHIGAAPAHSTGRSQALDFRAAVAMTGHLGVEFDLRKLTLEQLQELSAWIGFYRQHRVLLHAGRVWRGEAGDGLVWQAHGQLDARPDAQMLLFVYRMQPAGQKYSPSVRLPMLAGVEGLKVERLVPDGCKARDTGASAIFDSMAEGGIQTHGDWLARSGLPIPPMHAEACAIFRISREHS